MTIDDTSPQNFPGVIFEMFDAFVESLFENKEALVHTMMMDKLETKDDFAVMEWEVIEHCILEALHNMDYYKGYFPSIKHPDKTQLL